MKAQELSKGVESSIIPLCGECDYSGKCDLERRHTDIVLFWVSARIGLDTLMLKQHVSILSEL